jgi:ATP-dependent Lhr-like helicase
MTRLAATLERINASRLVVVDPPRPTPFAFPLMIERIREKFSNEKVADRVARMVAELEAAADREALAATTQRRRARAARNGEAAR